MADPVRAIMLRRYTLLIFIIGFGLHFFYSTVGWNHGLLDFHAFRQTQTAISVYYLVKDGFRLDYITPVLGPPWSIPFEFPLYQFVVAALVKMFNTSIDQTGRFVSMAFFYATLVPVYKVLGFFIDTIEKKFICLTFILVNPVYIFWSRAFLIESTALFFTWYSLYFFLQTIQTKKITSAICAGLAGSIAGLVKSTTLIGYAPIFLAAYIHNWINEKRDENFSGFCQYGWLLFFMLLPASSIMAWTVYADHLKSVNPIANDFITSRALVAWNFGTWEQRISIDAWLAHIFSNADLIIMALNDFYQIPIILVLVPIAVIFNKIRRKELLVCYIGYIAFPLIFTNLYYVHSYYAYANSIMASLLSGFLIISILEVSHEKIGLYVCIFLLPLALLFTLENYRMGYLSIQKSDTRIDQVLIGKVHKTVLPDEVILFYGFDWDPGLPYYLQRKALMDPRNRPLMTREIQDSLQEISRSRSRVSGMIVREGMPERFIDERLRYFKFSERPVYQDKGIVFYTIERDI